MNARFSASMSAVAVLLLATATIFAQKPELVVQTGHAAGVFCIAFHPGGNLMVSGGNEGTIKLWDVATGRELRTFVHPGHVPTRSIAFHPGGKIVVSGHEDGTIQLWDAATGKKLREFAGHSSSVDSIAFSPDGRLFASGSVDLTLKLWDVSACTKACKALHTLVPGYAGSQSIAFSPDSKLIASSQGKTIKLWNVTTGKQLRTFAGQVSELNSIVFSPLGKLLASVNDDGTVKLWEVATGKHLRTFVDPSARNQPIPYSGIHAAFSPDGRFLASMNSETTFKLWDIATGKDLRTFVERPASIYSIVFHPGGKIVASVNGDNTIKLWDAATGKELRTIVGHSSIVKSIAFSPDGKVLASTSADKFIRLWDLATGKELRTIACVVRSIAFSPDSEFLAGGGSNNTLKLWDVSSGKEMLTFGKPQDASIYSIAFNPNGKILASLVGGKTIRLWDVATGNELRGFVGRIALFEAIAFSPDGKLLALLRIDGKINLLDLASGKAQPAFGDYSPAVESIAFSPDGKLLPGVSDVGIKLWDVATGKEVRTLSGSSQINAIAFSPDGKLVASGGALNELKLWDVATGKELRRFVGATPRYDTWIAFHPSGTVLASVSEEEAIKLWDVGTGRELASLIGADKGDWLVVTPDGLFDGSPAGWNQVLWRFGGDTFNVAPAEIYFNDFYYPGLLSDIFAGQRPKAKQDIAQKDRRQPSVQLELSGPQLSPEKASETRTLSLRLKVAEAAADKEHTQGSGAQDVRLFRNGSLVKVWKGDVLKGSGSVVLEANDVAIVAGHNHFQAYAFNHDNIKSADAELLVKGADSLSRKGTAYILTIGVNEYANPQFNLHYAVADAQAFSAEFKHQQEILGQYARVEVIPLQDKEATKAGILRALEQLSTNAKPEDAVIVYFAGHGTAEGNRFYLIPHDIGYSGGREAITMESLDPILSHSISDVELQQGFEKMDAGQILLVIDACNSGQALEDEEKRRGPMNSKGLAQLAYEKGMYVLTAAQSYQAALELAQLGHGLLTYVLVEEGLKRSAADFEPKDGEVRLREWLDYAMQRVPQMQEEKLTQARAARSKLAGATAGTQKLAIQRPRIFYRRELEARSFVIARTAATQLAK